MTLFGKQLVKETHQLYLKVPSIVNSISKIQTATATMFSFSVQQFKPGLFSPLCILPLIQMNELN